MRGVGERRVTGMGLNLGAHYSLCLSHTRCQGQGQEVRRGEASVAASCASGGRTSPVGMRPLAFAKLLVPVQTGLTEASEAW